MKGEIEQGMNWNPFYSLHLEFSHELGKVSTDKDEISSRAWREGCGKASRHGSMLTKVCTLPKIYNSTNLQSTLQGRQITGLRVDVSC